jgi:hypothetical protein
MDPDPENPKVTSRLIPIRKAAGVPVGSVLAGKGCWHVLSSLAAINVLMYCKLEHWEILVLGSDPVLQCYMSLHIKSLKEYQRKPRVRWQRLSPWYKPLLRLFTTSIFGVSFYFNASFSSQISQYQLAKAEYVTTHHAQTGLIGCCGMGWGGSYIILFGPSHLLHRYRLCSLDTLNTSLKKEL